MKCLPSVVLLMWALGCGPGRVALPPPQPPLTPTPDADFRTAAPTLLSVPGTWDPPRVQAHTLGNGMRVLVVEQHDAPVVSFRYVNAGAGSYSAIQPGLPALTGLALLEGTRMADGSVGVGISVGGQQPWASTTAAGTFVGLDVVSTVRADALAMLARVVREPALDDGAIRSAMGQRYARLYEASRNIDGIVQALKTRALYGPSHPWATDVERTQQAIQAVTPADARGFHAQNYVPNVSALVVVGDVRMEEVIARVTEVFGDWHGHGRRSVAPELTPSSTENPIQAVLNGGDQTYLTIVHPAVGTLDPRLHAFHILAHILGDARANERLRHHAGQTYGVRATVHAYRNGGFLELQMAIENDAVLDAVRTVHREMARIREEGVTEPELAAAKAAYLSGFDLGGNADIADKLSANFARGLSIDWWTGARAQVDTIRVEDIQALAQGYLAPEQTRVVAVGNYLVTRRKLEQLGEVAYYRF